LQRGLVVLKLGGSVFADSSSMKRAARFVSELCKEKRVVVVVSALKGVTDELLNTAHTLCDEPPADALAQIVAMGERTSARLFCLSLLAHGVKAVLVDVDTPYWPIITNEDYMDADPILEKSVERCRRNITPLIESGNVPVIAGFIGLSEKGEVTTLGRGGSDTTATLLGFALGAEEVVLIKDVSGVHSADPKRVTEAKKVERLTIRELEELASSGAKVVHEKALKFVRGFRLRITSLSEGLSGGTLVEPDSTGITGVRDEGVEISVVSFVGLQNGSSHQRILSLLHELGLMPVALSFSPNSVWAYVSGSLKEREFHTLVENGSIKAFSIKRGLKCINVEGVGLMEEVGVLEKITTPLSTNRVNIYGLATHGNTIKLFVSEKDVERSMNLILDSLGFKKGE